MIVSFCVYSNVTTMQDAVLEVLKQAARLNKQILIEQTESIKHKHRSTRCTLNVLLYYNNV